MTWRDQLRPASFRGAAFFVQSHQAEAAGRRVQVHEYPLRDRPFAEDLGRQTRSFTFEAYVLGADYMAARDALIGACNRAGSGRLVHPYLGERTVACTGCRVTESTAEGRMARLSLEFVEAGENTFPRGVPDTASQLGTQADTASAAAKESFEGRFSTAGWADFVADAAEALVKLLSEDLIRAAGGTAGSGFSQAVKALSENARALGFDPAALAGEVQSAIAGLAAGSDSARRKTRRLLALPGFAETIGEPAGTTPSAKQIAANQAALISLTRRSAQAEAAALLDDADIGARQDLIELRDAFNGQFDAEEEAASERGDDDAFEAAGGLRKAVMDEIARRIPFTPRLVDLTLPASEPALVTAYRLYDDIGREGEILARNHIRHPLFVPGGAELEVLDA
ncbi:MAG: DNA circularization protein [Alphaproteobacteria bacterium]